MANKIIGVLTNRRAQATIWIILAVLLVASMVIFFTVINRGNINIIPQQSEPRAFIEKCTRDAVLEAEELMLPQGGFIDPQNYIIYNYEKVEYICKAEANFELCVMQHPVYLAELKQEIENYVDDKVSDCFADLRVSLQERGNEVFLNNDQTISVDLSPGRIYVNLNRTLTVRKGDSETRYTEFPSEVASPLYNLAVVAIEIANGESSNCNFEYAGYAITNRGVSISADRPHADENAIVYNIRDRISDKILSIAIRGCVVR